MNLRRFSSCALLGTLLAPWILGGNPALADKPSSVNVCVQREAQTPCFKVSENDPELITLMKRYEPDVKEIHIPLLSDAYESGFLFRFFVTWFFISIPLTIILVARMRPDPLELKEDEESNVKS